MAMRDEDRGLTPERAFESPSPEISPPSPRSPLASTTPPPLSLTAVRALATKPGARVPPGLLAAMHLRFVAQGSQELATELEMLFDLATGLSRAMPSVPIE